MHTVLHVVRRAEGGMRKHAAEILSRLRGQFSHRLAAPQSFFDSLPKSATEETAFVPIDIGDRIGPDTLRQALRLARYARHAHVDIIHSHGYKAAVTGVIAARLAGARSIVTGHNIFPEDASMAARLSLRFVARLSKRVIAIGPSLAESLKAAGVSPGKIEIIPNGVDLHAWEGRNRNTIREALGIDPGSVVVLCVARLTGVKGVEYLIKSARTLTERRSDIRILIVGDGPDKTSLECLAEEIAPDGITFLGQRDDVPDLLAAADVVAIPSLSEGQGLILLEAMASGRPVVASRVGGLADIVKDGETGLLVPPADPDALARAVLKVVESPESAAELARAARSCVEDEFAIERMIARTEEVYLCVVS